MSTSLNDRYLKDFINEDEYCGISSQIKFAHDALHNGTGLGNDFIGWLNLPENYDKDEFARIKLAAEKIKKNTDVFIVIGIGGSYLGARAAIEFLKSPNYNVLKKDTPDIYFTGNSISSTALSELVEICEGKDVSINMISKSGTTTEPAIAFRVFRELLEKKYGKEEAAKRIYVTTDKAKGTLKAFADKEGYETFVVPDDVGGRFSAFDDHALFTLIWAGLSKSDMVSLLSAAQEVSSQSLSEDLEINDALKEGIFWADAKMNGISASVHQYMGSMFENTVYWHAQMQNESVKDTLKQVAKVPDAMHHSAEAHFNPANKLVFALTVPVDNGVCSENAQAYIKALASSYEVTGAFFLEEVETSSMGLTAAAAGAVTQLRAFATCYQEIVEAVTSGRELPEVLDSVLQPHVEFYKKALKGGVVVPGRLSK